MEWNEGILKGAMHDENGCSSNSLCIVCVCVSYAVSDPLDPVVCQFP